jgi:hypothetical protein
MVEVLMVKETIEQDEIAEILGGGVSEWLMNNEWWLKKYLRISRGYFCCWFPIPNRSIF